MVCAFLFLFLYRIFAGYFAARLYKTCKGQNWKKSALLVICNFLIDDQHAHLLSFHIDVAAMFALDFWHKNFYINQEEYFNTGIMMHFYYLSQCPIQLFNYWSFWLHVSLLQQWLNSLITPVTTLNSVIANKDFAMRLKALML